MAIQLLQGLDIRSTEPVDARLTSANLLELNPRLVYNGLVAYQTAAVTSGLDQGVLFLLMLPALI